MPSDAIALFPHYCSRCDLWCATEASIEVAGCRLVCTLCGGSTLVKGRAGRSEALVARLKAFAATVVEHHPELGALTVPGAHCVYRPQRLIARKS